MAGPIESKGPIEAFCQVVDAPMTRHSLHSFDVISAGDRVAIFFVADDGTPPYSLKVRAPSGTVVIDRMLRELPTGRPQSEPPIEFVVSSAGTYTVDVKEMKGNQWGKATIRVV